jgi:hypothetical protein
MTRLTVAIVLLTCMVLGASSVLADGAAEFDINRRSEDSHQQQPGLTRDVAAAAGDEEEPTAEEPRGDMDTPPFTRSVLRGRSLGGAMLSTSAKLVTGNSTEDSGHSLVSLSFLHNSNLTSSGLLEANNDISPSQYVPQRFVTLACACYANWKTSKTRLCSPFPSEGCTSYATSPWFYDFVADQNVNYSFQCWCPSSPTLVKRQIVASVVVLGVARSCSYFKTTKSAFGYTCKFTANN